MAHGALGDNAKKRELLERVLPIFSRAYGTDHPRTELCQRKLADVRADLEFPLHPAAKRGDVDAMTQLLDDGAEVNTEINGTTPLYCACKGGHVDAARLLLERGAKIDETSIFKGMEGVTPLHIASYGGHIEVVRLLLERGADVHLEAGGMKPMDLARQLGHEALLDLLNEHASGVARF